MPVGPAIAASARSFSALTHSMLRSLLKSSRNTSSGASLVDMAATRARRLARTPGKIRARRDGGKDARVAPADALARCVAKAKPERAEG